MRLPPLFSSIDGVTRPFFRSPTVDVLRLAFFHPVVSGNKWFKLKEYLAAAEAAKKTTLLTFGGAYSNHLVATAAAAQMNELKSIGIVRGEQPEVLSHTLHAAMGYGMSLLFISRKTYREKIIPPTVFDAYCSDDVYIIPEGGYGALGVEGAKDILLQNETDSYTHFLLAVGTGTTLAGLVAAALPHQKIIGITVLKNAASLRQEIEALLPKEKHDQFDLIPDYHFGGYAKYNSDLLNFMNALYQLTNLPTDFVYTGKAFFAAFRLIGKKYFPDGAKLLIIHTGGLQGNASLKKDALIFN